jgi:exoenzyme U
MNIISKGFEPTIVARDVGPRRITLAEHGDGTSDLELAPPPIRKLILSGGGAKGVAYSGAVTALDSLGVLPQIVSVHGSSVGAITAALIASGMDAARFDALSDSTDLLSLLDSPNENVSWLQRGFARVGEMAEKALPGTVGGFTRLLLSVLPRVQSEALPLQTLIRDQTRAAVLALIEDTHPAEVLAVRERLQAGGVVTFGDLALLNRHIPQIKRLNITGTAMLGELPQLVVFSDALTPDLDIDVAAHVSASLPVVFRQPKRKGFEFQELDELTFFQDGGVMLNTPVPQLIDPALATDLLSGSDMLILKFEKKPSSSERGGLKKLLTDWLAGGAVSAGREYQNLSLKAFAAQTVIVPLRTEKGDFSGALDGTLNFTMSPEIKNHLQERLEQAVRAHLNERAARRERYQFASLTEALLSLDDDMLADIGRHAVASSAVVETIAWRALARGVLERLNAQAQAFDATLNGELRATISELDALTKDEVHVQWLALELNRYDQPGAGRLLASLHGQNLSSVVLGAALQEARRREIRVIAGNIRKAVIFPSLHLMWQTHDNTELLLRADQILLRATQAAEINRALDEIIAGYRSRNRLPGKLWTPKTVELATAWKINP